MSTFGITFGAGRASAAIRAADALLRSMGNTAVTLRLPSSLAIGGTSSEIGITPPSFDDVDLTPAAVRSLPGSQSVQTGGNVRGRFELLVSATAVLAQVEKRNVDSAEDLFASALGVIHNGTLLRIESLTADEYSGSAYLYRVIAAE